MTDKQPHDVLEKLALLAPGEGEEPRPAKEALAALQRHLPAQTAGWQRFLRRITNMFKMKHNMRRLAFGGLLVALIAAAFAFPGTRAAASNFLGLFRVQKFAPISISPEQLARLESLELEEGIYPADFEWVKEPGEPQTVPSIEAATDRSGLNWLLDYNQALGQPAYIAVSETGVGRLTVNLDGARALLEAAEIDPNLLPDELDGAKIVANMPAAVMMRWEENDTILIQARSPEISYPDGFNPAPIGQAVLELLGMPPEEAYRLSNNIDWTNTLLLPIPQDLATFQEVSIGETTGLLVTQLDGQYSSLVWQTMDRIYMLSNNGDSDALIELATQ